MDIKASKKSFHARKDSYSQSFSRKRRKATLNDSDIYKK